MHRTPRTTRTTPSAVALFTLLAFSLPLPAHAENRVLAGDDYFPVVRAALARANESIDIQMYFIIAEKANGEPPSAQSTPVRLLLQELINASRRGVAVRVVLEDGKFAENYQAYVMLQRAGIDVRFDGPGELLHSKLIVIDRRITIVGSTNWSRAALRDNREAAVLVESAQLANELLATFEQIDFRTLPPVPVPTDGLKLPVAFLPVAAQMVHDRAEYAFDLFLLLARAAAERKTNTVPLDSRTYKKALGCRNVRRPLLRLEERYGLISYDSAGQRVTLREQTGPHLTIPFEYWKYGIKDQLSLRAKFMWCVNLKEAAESRRNPCWFRSQTDLTARYGISHYTVSLGLRELERLDLVEILRDPARSANHADRKANVYRVNPLIPPQIRATRLHRLKREHGAEKVEQAVALAKQLDDPKDLDKILAFLRLIDRYGWRTVRAANRKTARLKRGSGRRTVETTARLLK